jgi:acylphosphatase
MNQKEMNNIEELHAVVRGIVQAVGFRYFVVEKARTLGLCGYVRNDSYGDVEVLAQGPRPTLDRLLTYLWQGPPAAQVNDVQTTWNKPTQQISGFHVRW